MGRRYIALDADPALNNNLTLPLYIDLIQNISEFTECTTGWYSHQVADNVFLPAADWLSR